MNEQLLNEHDVAGLLKVSLASIRRWRQERQGPNFIKIGASVRYRSGDVQKWIRQQPGECKVPAVAHA